jgi:pimeloyl-ACP methyl ester carboxylesterase
MGARGADQWQRLLVETSAETEMLDESPLCLDAMTRLTVPTLLMYGRMSHCLPTSEKLEALLPEVRRVLVPGAGHFFPVVKPQFFARALRMFLARVDSRAGRPVPDTTAPLVARTFGSREQPVLRRRG